jgi:hypothetical protein
MTERFRSLGGLGISVSGYKGRFWALLAACMLSLALACGSAEPKATGVASASRAGSPTPSSSCIASAPSHRYGASAAYDAAHGVIILFGGDSGGHRAIDETWLFDGACWQQAHVAVSPPQRIVAGMAYNPIVKRTLLIGGRSLLPDPRDYPEDAWTWDGSGWMKLAGAPKLRFPLASYDETRQVVVVFGWGPASVPETWIWDGATWTRKVSAQSPTTYSQSAMCFDKTNRQVILYGGVTHDEIGGISSSTWLWDGNIWTKTQPAHSPGPRFEHVLLCGHQTILFGGMTNQQGSTAKDTWAWDGSDWRRLATIRSPQDCCGAAVYDGSRYMVLGTARDGIPVWSWNGSDWAE